MKKLLQVFLFVGVLMPGLAAQSLLVTETSPVNNAVNVDQDSIKITFNKKIDLSDSSFVDGLVVPFLVLPFDSVEIGQLRLSDDSLSIIFDANFAENADFTFLVLNATAVDEDKLAEPYLFRFTTSANAGEFVINGALTQEEMAKLRARSSTSHLNGLTVLLSEENLNLGLDFDEYEDEEAEDETDPLSVSHIAFVDPVSGEYSISGVREGDFFPYGLNIFTSDQEIEGFPEIYIYDPNEDFTFDTLKVNSGNAPNDTLNNIDLRKLEFIPFTFGEAINRTSSLGFGSDVDVAAGFTEIPLTFESFEEQHKRLFKGLPFVASMNDHQAPFFNPENGTSIIWSMFFYNSTLDSLHLIGVSPFGAQLIETVGPEDVEIPVELSTLNVLPEEFIDSDSAAAIAEMNGGMQFRQEYGNANFASVEFLIAHAYWEYPLDNSPAAPTFWRVQYRAESFNFPFKQSFEHDSFQQDSLVFYIDSETGEILYKAGNELTDGPSFNVVSSSPIDGAVAITDTTTISITFDAPVRMDEFDPFGDGIEILTFPFESIDILEVTASDVGRTLNFKAVHEDETDFTWIVSKAENTAGGKLERPYVFNYSTSASNGPQTVSGTISSEDEPAGKQVSTNQFDGVMVALFTSNPFNENGDDEVEGNEGPDFTIAKAILADTTTGTYTLEGVRDGVYFPLAINLINDGFDDTPSAIGIFDPEDDGSLNSITISGSNLTGIDIVFKPFAPITAGKAVSIANAAAAELDSELALYFMFSEETLIEYDQFPDSTNEDNGPKKIGQSYFKLQSEDSTPTGTGEDWGLLYYNSTSETALAFSVNPFGVGIIDTVDTQEFLEELEFQEGTSFDDLSPLASTFFDSDLAAANAEENGGNEFRQGDIDFLDVEYVAINAPSLLPEGITPDGGGGVWVVIYSKETFNEQNFNSEFRDFEVFIDFEDGSFLGSNLEEDEPFTALDGRAAADTLAIQVHDDNKLYLIDARGNIFVDPELDQQNKAQSSEDSNTDIQEGKFFFVEYLFYSKSKDQETPIGVDASGEAFFLGNDSSTLPEGVSYADLEIISETIIDSDSAVAIADANGAEDFRNNLGSNFDLVRLDIEVQAGNRFWLYPDGVDSSLVTWSVRFTRRSQDQSTEEFSDESAEFLINAETGEVLAQQILTSNNDPILEIPNRTELGQNYPNPFNPSTTIPFSLKQATNVELTIYNMLGQKVSTLVNQKYSAGSHFATWNASSLASGMYIYRLKAGNVIQTKKLMLIK